MGPLVAAVLALRLGLVSSSLWDRGRVREGKVGQVGGDAFEHQLYQDLLKNYNPLERPVQNNSLPVKVTLGVILQQIVDLVRIPCPLSWPAAIR